MLKLFPINSVPSKNESDRFALIVMSFANLLLLFNTLELQFLTQVWFHSLFVRVTFLINLKLKIPKPVPYAYIRPILFSKLQFVVFESKKTKQIPRPRITRVTCNIFFSIKCDIYDDHSFLLKTLLLPKMFG